MRTSSYDFYNPPTGKSTFPYSVLKKNNKKRTKRTIRLLKRSYESLIYGGMGYYGNQEYGTIMDCECYCGKKICPGDKYIRMGGGSPVKNIKCVIRYLESHEKAYRWKDVNA